MPLFNRNTDNVTEEEEVLKTCIKVKICDRDNGLEEVDDVAFVRIVSKQYNLLIMADYLPIIGEVEGSISYRTSEREYERNNIRGFFMHKNNEFSLMIKENLKQE